MNLEERRHRSDSFNFILVLGNRILLYGGRCKMETADPYEPQTHCLRSGRLVLCCCVALTMEIRVEFVQVVQNVF